MPASCKIDNARRLVMSRAWGVLIDDDLRGTQKTVREWPGFEPDFSQIYDFSDVTEVAVTGDGLRDLGRHSPFARNARRAVVVSSDVAFGMVRMFEISSDRDPSAFRIFRSLKDAEGWINDEEAGGAGSAPQSGSRSRG